jgi:hypothetical protein
MYSWGVNGHIYSVLLFWYQDFSANSSILVRFRGHQNFKFESHLGWNCTSKYVVGGNLK